ncbi:hypothetical protein ACQP2F_08960 [Actinoplanes sp. CA-030573]|uniref:hypothetical protein n=1 Tax=Actinoplanes sp. CA-030573 TaxID=3239898 RepID=UPI003D9225DB
MDEPAQLTDRDKLQKELLWSHYAEFRATARQVEVTRSNATNYAMLVASALIAVISLDKAVNRSDRPLCVVLVEVSFFAALYAFAYGERYLKNKRRAHFVLLEIDRRFFDDRPASGRLHGLSQAADAGEGRFTGVFGWINRIAFSTHLFWVIVPLVIFVLGCLLLIQTFVA